MAEVLETLETLTRGMSSGQDETGSREGQARDGEPGEYTKLTHQFETWTGWVQDIWSMRDANSGSPSSPGSPMTLEDFTRDSRRNESIPKRSGVRDEEHFVYRPIESLGDAFKASLRSIGTTLDRLEAKVNEATNDGADLPPIVEPQSSEDDKDNESKKVSGVRAEAHPTPRRVVDMVNGMIKSMKEELQLMREVEFEVCQGEREWVSRRLEGLD